MNINSSKTSVLVFILLLLFVIVLRLNDSVHIQALNNVRENKMLTPKEMNEDLTYLIEVINSVHPATYESEPIYLTRSIEESLNNIQEIKSSKQFYFDLSRVASSLGDGQTRVLYPLYSSSKIELPLIWLKRALTVSQNTSKLKKGDQVISINGIKIPKIMMSLKEIVSTGNEHYLRYCGQQLLSEESVLRYLGLIAKDNTVHIEVRRDNEVLTYTLHFIKNLKGINVKSNLKSEYIKDNSLGILTCDNLSNSKNVKEYIDNFFRDVHKLELNNVVIDLRDSSVGDKETIDYLLSYIVGSNEIQQYQQHIRNSTLGLKQKKDIKKTKGLTKFLPTVFINKCDKTSLKFQGKIYILTSNKTTNEALRLATVAYDNKLATIIGEPTGSSPSYYGDSIKLKLPNSGYDFIVSTRKYLRPNPDNDPSSTLIPHHIVYTVSEDIKKEIDPQLNFVISELSEKIKKD